MSVNRVPGITSLLTAATVLSCLTAAVAFASEQAQFNTLDRNHDERLSSEELASFPQLAQWFDAADENGDGQLDPSEFGRLASRIEGPMLPE
jgi:Ca2+-binding EF-hand superfamily protein